ncbi:MAG TPA: hypothetical protein PKA64_25270 [Myxococcota bacterium]|nr:hypothetical protein [Myxococcota bacterium]
MVTLRMLLLYVAAFVLAPRALADGAPASNGGAPAPNGGAPAEEEEVLRAPVLIRIPPRVSWEAALYPTFVMLPQFVDAPAWLGLGIRGSAGRNFGNHRIGGGLAFSIEGQISIQWSNNFEPQVMWDYVGNKSLWLGASLGADLILNADIPPGQSRGLRYSFDPSPLVSLRIGYSQPWGIGVRRFFVGLEPKLRVIDGSPAAGIAILIGSGGGR